jgi:hypothetical protein
MRNGRRKVCWARPLVLTLPLIAFLACPSRAATILGTSQSFAVLGGSAVTNIGVTIIDGNLGVYPKMRMSREEV